MTFTLLFDLDDTLLDTNLDTFLGEYFKKLALHMSSKLPPEQFTRALLQSTQIMYGNKRPERSMEQVFSDNFYPSLGIRQAELADALEKFYDEVFPTLAELTMPRPEAIDLIEWAFRKGWNVAIATDPLFPRKAILHRLRWAGLAPEKYPFRLISDFHNFHFAKASVAFFPEFLARMGWNDEPVLMVGDSFTRDVSPAQKAGVPVFWLKENDGVEKLGIPQGGFGELRNFLETTDLPNLKVNYASPEALIAFLLATPAIFHNYLRENLPNSWKLQKEPNEWSLGEIICHLRDVDMEVNFPRVEVILRDENAFIPGQSTDNWAEERQYIRQDPVTAFHNFVEIRLKLINKLTRLSQSDWLLRAQHSYLGPTTLIELVEFMVDHDRLHIKQAAESLTRNEMPGSVVYLP